MPLEYTIQIGYDSHVSAGYAKYVTSTPEEAIALRGTKFHPDFDVVVRREVGTTEWTYEREDQKYDYRQKIGEYRQANHEENIRRLAFRPKQSSALPLNRGVKTYGPFIRSDEPLSIWYYTQGELDIDKSFNRENS
ncbi:hypothetical protein QEH42_gp215 [Microbacterium phage Pumpernickel]|uniref:Uncharacterized protein n=1 Tax=Microbacterium phage Pumpernickel TaxID=2885983 RepID=A0AAE8Y8I1_9CAUD|nr:hypothetical protein QEH42_gp215 [Microbacterium phage Pumpernickel]UDL16003.1 hypothetical protein SEA_PUMPERNICKEL_253 [Microbacterium phage Pumpernickel]